MSGGFASRAERRQAAIAWIKQQFAEQNFGFTNESLEERFRVSHVTARSFRREAEEQWAAEGHGEVPQVPRHANAEDAIRAATARSRAKRELKEAQASDDLPWDDEPGSPPARRSGGRGGGRRGGGDDGEGGGLVSYWNPARPQDARSRQPIPDPDFHRARSIVTAAQYEHFLVAGMVRLSQVSEEALADLENVRKAAFTPAGMTEMGPVWLNNAMKALVDLTKAYGALHGELRAYGKELRALNKERFEHEGAERFADAVIQAVQEQLGEGAASAFLARVDELCQHPSDAASE